MVDIYHDARWGRVKEGAGEDPFLGGIMAQAWCVVIKAMIYRLIRLLWHV